MSDLELEEEGPRAGRTIETLMPVPRDTVALRRAYGCFPSGVVALCAQGEDEALDGLAASSFTTVSLDPPLVAVFVQNTSTTWPRLRRRPRLGLSLLAEQQTALCRQLAAKNGDRFAAVDWWATDDGAVLLAGAVGWLECSIYDELPAGDHVIALLHIHRLSADPETAPLVFHASSFRRLHSAS